jgi:hypothetical protein
MPRSASIPIVCATLATNANVPQINSVRWLTA